jgi:hypothetical protein
LVAQSSSTRLASPRAPQIRSNPNGVVLFFCCCFYWRTFSGSSSNKQQTREGIVMRTDTAAQCLRVRGAHRTSGAVEHAGGQTTATRGRKHGDQRHFARPMLHSQRGCSNIGAVHHRLAQQHSLRRCRCAKHSLELEEESQLARTLRRRSTCSRWRENQPQPTVQLGTEHTGTQPWCQWPGVKVDCRLRIEQRKRHCTRFPWEQESIHDEQALRS